MVAWVLSAAAIEILFNSPIEIPKALAISLAFLKLIPVTSNLPCSWLYVANEPDAFINASCNPSTLFVASYINLSGSLKSPIAPPKTCKFATKSIAPSGLNTLSAIVNVDCISILNSLAFFAIVSRPWTPFLNPYSLSLPKFDCKSVVTFLALKPNDVNFVAESPNVLIVLSAPKPTFSNSPILTAISGNVLPNAPATLIVSSVSDLFIKENLPDSDVNFI